MEDAVLDVHVYQTNEADVFEEFTNGTRGEGDEVMAASVCELPSQGLEGVWDRYSNPICMPSLFLTRLSRVSLVYPDEIKPRLLNYIYATLVFSDADVDCELLYVPWFDEDLRISIFFIVNIVSWNR